MVLPVLGFHFLQPKPVVTPSDGETTASESPLFCLTVVGAEAKAREIGGEFVVQKGSTCRKEGLKSWTSYKALRDQLVEDGKLIESEQTDFYVFNEDVGFSSPSAGAAVVNAGNMNGRMMWKTADTGETYQQWHENKLQAASRDDSNADE